MRYKTITNRFGKKIDMHLCQTKDGSYIIGIPDGMKDNSEMFVQTYQTVDKVSKNILFNSLFF